MPVLPANAAKGAGDLSDTTWLFREQLSLPPWVDSLASTLDLEVSFAFKDNPDFIFTDIFYNADTKKLHYVSEDAQSVFVYDFNTGSWVNDIFRDVGFTPIQSDNPYFSLWIESNASLQSGDYTYIVPLVQPDPTYGLLSAQWECKKLVMTGEYVPLSAFPDGYSTIPLEFTSAGKSFSSINYSFDAKKGWCLYYDSTLVYQYSDLTGTAASSWINDAYPYIYILPKQTVPEWCYTWLTTCYQIIGSDPFVPQFTTTVNIWDAAGTSLLHSVSFTGNTAPAPVLAVTSSGCSISTMDQTSTWDASGTPFYGLRYAASSSADYKPGSYSMLLGGDYENVKIDLYVVDQAPPASDNSDVSDLTSLFGPIFQSVFAFFTLEFVPGFSFGRIFDIALVVGLLFFFLKFAK